MKIGALTAILTSTFIVQYGDVSAQPSAERRDLVVSAKSLTPELVAAVADLGQPQILQAVPRGTDLLALISAKCGTANARRYYLPIFLRANSSNDDVRSGETVLSKAADITIPSCFFANETYSSVPSSGAGVDFLGAVAVDAIAAETIRTSSDSKWNPIDEIRTPASSNTNRRTSQSSKVNDLATTRSPASMGRNLTTEKMSRNIEALADKRVDSERIENLASQPLPADLSRQGVNIIETASSDRLLDPLVRDRYSRLLNQALTNNKVGVNAELAVQSLALERAFRTQDFIASNNLDKVNFKALPSTTTFVGSINTEGIYAAPLKDGVTVQAARERLASAATKDPSLKSAMKAYQPYFAQPQSSGGLSSCQTRPDDEWPINTTELRYVLEIRKAATRPLQVGKLAIFDTGFPQNKEELAPFLKNYFVPKPPYAGDSAGDPLLWSSTARYYSPESPDANHGVAVLALSLGGPRILREKILENATESVPGRVLAFTGYHGENGSLDIDGSSLQQLLVARNWRRVNVAGINLSMRFILESIKDLPDFPSSIAKKKEVLFVFAAGNDSEEIYNTQPANWGGYSVTNVITVAAMTPNGELWSKSNFSSHYVDIGAPGCGVPTYSYSIQNDKFETVILDGTSMAAPLVSFAGNLLRELNTGTRIKTRIVASGRYNSSLASKSWSARQLDVPVAIATPFDAVRLEDGHLALGRLEWNDAETICGSSTDDAQSIAQIHRVSVGSVNVMYRNPLAYDELQPPKSCGLVGNELKSVRFQEVFVKDGKLARKGVVRMLDMRKVESITFCEECASLPQQ